MAKKRESLWAAYSFSKLLLPVAIFGPAIPHVYATCTLMLLQNPVVPWEYSTTPIYNSIRDSIYVLSPEIL